MSKFDYLQLDGNSLRTFLIVLEEKSVSRASERLGISQSAVSHTLDKLRMIFNDPLFVRAGRGIASTPRARALGAAVEPLMDNLKTLTDHREFDPRVEQASFTIAANDFPIQLIFPPMLNQLRQQGINPETRFMPAGIPSIGALNASRYALLITPTPPVDRNLEKVSLMRARMQIFYDPRVRTPPTTLTALTESTYVDVRFSDTETSLQVLSSASRANVPAPTISVPNFSLLPPMLVGTDRITVQLAFMKLGLLHDLEVTPLPFKSDEIDLYLVWHKRETDDPAHRWFREKIIETADSITGSSKLVERA